MTTANTLAALVNSSSQVVVPSGGINFSDIQTAASGTTSEILDGYEEGTWTPTVTSGTISTAVGNYTKIGRVVTVSAQIGGFSDRTSSSNLDVSSLPFNVGVQAVGGSTLARYITGATTLTAFAVISTHVIRFYEVASGNYETLKYSQLNNSISEIYFNAIYFTS